MARATGLLIGSRLPRASSRTSDDHGPGRNSRITQARSISCSAIQNERKGHSGSRTRRQRSSTTRVSCRRWAAELGRSLVALDRLGDAFALAEISAKSSAGTDVVAEVLWRGVQARVLALRGRAAAVEIASEAVAIARQTEYLHLTADALVDLARGRRTGRSRRPCGSSGVRGHGTVRSEGEISSRLDGPRGC